MSHCSDQFVQPFARQRLVRSLVAGVVLCLGFGGHMAATSAQAASLLPPPSTAPRSLPPLPTSTVPLPPTSLPPPSGTIPTQDNTAAVEAYSTENFEEMLHTEANRLAHALGGQMAVAVLRTDKPQYKQFVANGLLKMSMEEFARRDSGLAGMVSVNGRMNGAQTPVCYVLMDAEHGESLWKRFVLPLQAVSHPQSGAAWLVGHEVGHCLDQLERAQKITSRLSWRPQDSKTIGIWPEAAAKVYGATFSREAFLKNPQLLYEQPAQQQYGERVADAFATFWVLKLGADRKAVDILKNIRATVPAYRAHNTEPVFDVVLAERDYVMRQQRVDLLWAMARAVQQQVGVAPQAVAANPAVVESATTTSSATAVAAVPEAVRWVVTPRGPVGLDAQGNVVPQSQNLPTPRNFNSLPRFGQ